MIRPPTMIQFLWFSLLKPAICGDELDAYGLLQIKKDRTSNLGQVDALYTFGATGGGRHWNALSTDGCFPGLRVYTSDNGKSKADFGASISTRRHAKTSVLELHWHEWEPSFFRPCTTQDRHNAQEDRWPITQWPSVSLHDIFNGTYLNSFSEDEQTKGVYRRWLYETKYFEAQDERSFDIDRFKKDVFVDSAFKAGVGPALAMAAATSVYYCKCKGAAFWEEFRDNPSVKMVNRNTQAWMDTNDALKEKLNWKLVHCDGPQHKDRDEFVIDTDHQALVQNNETFECVLSFMGTEQHNDGGNGLYGGNSWKDHGNALDSAETDFCDLSSNPHSGAVKELKWIVESPQWPTLRSKLGKCSGLTVTGHSLGGMIAELFSACVNKHAHIGHGFGNFTWDKSEQGSLIQPCCENPDSEKGQTIQILGGNKNPELKYLGSTDQGRAVALSSWRFEAEKGWQSFDTGKQRWIFEPILDPSPGSNTWDQYWHIKVACGAGESGTGRHFLSTNPEMDWISLWPTDDESGRQQWVLEPVGPVGERLFYIRASEAGVRGNGRYLSGLSNNDQVRLWWQDTGFGRQRWKVESVGEQLNVCTSEGADGSCQNLYKEWKDDPAIVCKICGNSVVQFFCAECCENMCGAVSQPR